MEKAPNQAMQKIKHKILVMSNKGGVGKSTVAVNLAFGLAQQGFQVGLLDVDMHGPNIPKMLAIEDMVLTGDEKKIQPVAFMTNLKVVSMAFLMKEKESPLIWRGPLKMGAIKQFLEDVSWGDLDFLVIDSPPGTGDEPLSVVQLIKDIDGTIIVTTPQDLALLDSRKAVNFAKRLNMPVLGIVENMSGFVCPHCGKKTDLFKTGGGEKAAREMNVPFLGKIPIEPEIVVSGDEGKPFIQKHSETQTSQIFNQIVEQLIEKLKPNHSKENK
jgi:ATP-binding protein involved in chromosome partitioning